MSGSYDRQSPFRSAQAVQQPVSAPPRPVGAGSFPSSAEGTAPAQSLPRVLTQHVPSAFLSKENRRQDSHLIDFHWEGLSRW